MKIQIKHRFNSSILFEHECENNTIKETLIQGIKTGANLQFANLQFANLQFANLQFANLQFANLISANLQNAYLERANLENANLENANLENAELPIFSKWLFSIINNKFIKIGCKEKTICEWDLWFASKKEFATKRGTPEFKQIEAMYLAHKAYLTHLNL
jgi:hypothetical protein